MNKFDSQKYKDEIHSACSLSELYTASFTLAVTSVFSY